MVVKTQHSMRVGVLTIAGSDSGGASGIQADLKTFAAFDVHGLSVVTAVTAQNTRTIQRVHNVPPANIRAQLRAVFDDFRIGAVKIGMLGSAAAIDAVADALREFRAGNVVLDPVLVSSSGTPLLPARAIARLRERLLPMADVLTPNLPEAEALLGMPLAAPDERRHAARALLSLGPRAVLLKGGHAKGGKVYDYFVASERGDSVMSHTFAHRRLPILARGTGCTLASAIAANLALGAPGLDAVREAERYLQLCLRSAYRAGRGARRLLDHARK